MRVLYDTSVLVPAFLANHAAHPLAFPQLEMAQREDIQGYLSAHSLAEFYAVTTRLPLPLRIFPSEAHATILRFLKHLMPVELSADDYWQAITHRVAFTYQFTQSAISFSRSSVG